MLYTVSLNPLEISDLYLWVDASDISSINNGSLSSTDGTNVDKITDKKGGVQLLNTTGSKPVYKHKIINGKNVIKFEHVGVTNNSLQSSMITTTLTQKTIFFVFLPIHNIYNGNQFPLSIYSTSNPIGGTLSYYPEISIMFNETKQQVSYLESYDYSNLSVNQLSSSSIDNLQIVSVRTSLDVNKYDFVRATMSLFNQYGSETPKLQIDNWYVTIGDVVDNTYSVPTNDPPKAIPFEGYFCELLIFNDILSDYDYNRVSEYLKSKWIEGYNQV